jgi:hypothetical protein
LLADAEDPPITIWKDILPHHQQAPGVCLLSWTKTARPPTSWRVATIDASKQARRVVGFNCFDEVCCVFLCTISTAKFVGDPDRMGVHRFGGGVPLFGGRIEMCGRPQRV